MAGVAIALLAVSFTTLWYEYDHTTGRRTPPDGAYNNGEDGVIDHHLEFYATHWTGDIEPADTAAAERALLTIQIALPIMMVSLLLVALGEVPGIHRIINRPVSLVFVLVAMLGLLAVASLTWVWLPGSLAEYGVDSTFTARLDPPDEYTKTKLGWGWYSMALTFPFILGAGLYKFQAGTIDPNVVEEYLDAGRSDV